MSARDRAEAYINFLQHMLELNELAGMQHNPSPSALHLRHIHLLTHSRYTLPSGDPKDEATKELRATVKLMDEMQMMRERVDTNRSYNPDYAEIQVCNPPSHRPTTATVLTHTPACSSARSCLVVATCAATAVRPCACAPFGSQSVLA